MLFPICSPEVSQEGSQTRPAVAIIVQSLVNLQQQLHHLRALQLQGQQGSLPPALSHLPMALLHPQQQVLGSLHLLLLPSGTESELLTARLAT